MLDIYVPGFSRRGGCEGAVRVHLYEVDDLPVSGVAKRRGEYVVVVLRRGLRPDARRRLLERLLSEEELAALGGDEA
jgi:hypothetical protein